MIENSNGVKISEAKGFKTISQLIATNFDMVIGTKCMDE